MTHYGTMHHVWFCPNKTCIEVGTGPSCNHSNKITTTGQKGLQGRMLHPPASRLNSSDTTPFWLTARPALRDKGVKCWQRLLKKLVSFLCRWSTIRICLFDSTRFEMCLAAARLSVSKQQDFTVPHCFQSWWSMCVCVCECAHACTCQQVSSSTTAKDNSTVTLFFIYTWSCEPIQDEGGQWWQNYGKIIDRSPRNHF